MPVAVAPINRQLDAAPREFGLQRGDQRPHLVVQRTLAAEVVVMLGHGEQPLPRHVPSAGDVLQERHDIFTPLRPAETDD